MIFYDNRNRDKVSMWDESDRLLEYYCNMKDEDTSRQPKPLADFENDNY